MAAETGQRRESIINLKFNDVEYDPSGINFIKTEDYKINKIQNRKDENRKIIYIPITQGLQSVLDDLGYNSFQNTNRYILAPEIISNRKRVIAESLSRAFSHYYSQLKTNRQLTFRSLRKAYLTRLQLYLGDNAKLISQHAGSAVIHEHYVDRKAIARAAKNFEVFPTEVNREQQLKKLRDKTEEKDNLKSKTNEIIR